MRWGGEVAQNQWDEVMKKNSKKRSVLFQLSTKSRIFAKCIHLPKSDRLCRVAEFWGRLIDWESLCYVVVKAPRLCVVGWGGCRKMFAKVARVGVWASRE